MVQKPEQPVSAQELMKAVLIGLIALLVASILLLSAVPPVSRDALTHHLAVPKLYLKQGRIYEIPSLDFSYYPMNLDLLYTIALYLGNDVIPKYIHFAFAILTAWLIFSYLKKRCDTLPALLGVVFFLSLPVILKLSVTIYVDLGLAFFSTAALIYFMKWIESVFKLKYLIVSAICCGLGMGTKYNGLLVLLILTLFVPFVYSRKKNDSGAVNGPQRRFFGATHSLKAAGCGFLFFLTAGIVFSPWAVRNYMWTSNPVYPLYRQYFPDPEKGPDTDVNAGGFLTRKMLYHEAWWQALLVPVRIFLQGQDDNPKYFDGRLNPYLLLFPIFAFLGHRKEAPGLRTEKKIFLAFSLLYLVYAFFQIDMRIRYIIPIIAPLVILSILGINNLLNAIEARLSPRIAKLGKGCLVGSVLLLLCLNGAYVLQLFRWIEPVAYLSGQIDREKYIAKRILEYPALKFANQNLAANDKILALYLGNRGYYCEREIIFGEKILQATVLQATSPASILTALKQKNITHLLIRLDIFIDEYSRQFNEEKLRIVDQFFRQHTNRVFSARGYGLFKLTENE